VLLEDIFFHIKIPQIDIRCGQEPIFNLQEVRMFTSAYLVEILTPKRTDPVEAKDKINLFAERFYRVLDCGLGLSVPDNPMGQPRFSLLEMIEQHGLPVEAQKTVMNLNTFHSKAELDRLLTTAAHLGVTNVLVVRGDGGPKLPKLDAKSIGGNKNVATSIDLIRYINAEYRGKFTTGCAYNQYSPMPFELNRLTEKIAAGARFVITQPVIGKDPNVDALFGYGIPVVIEAWMSKNVELLFRSVRKSGDEKAIEYDPASNLKTLQEAYPDSCIYLSMLGFKKQWHPILPFLRSS
jgi:methylenetetrahydrofolate reductase (NADPH)